MIPPGRKAIHRRGPCRTDADLPALTLGSVEDMLVIDSQVEAR